MSYKFLFEQQPDWRQKFGFLSNFLVTIVITVAIEIRINFKII